MVPITAKIRDQVSPKESQSKVLAVANLRTAPLVAGDFDRLLFLTLPFPPLLLLH